MTKSQSPIPRPSGSSRNTPAGDHQEAAPSPELRLSRTRGGDVKIEGEALAGLGVPWPRRPSMKMPAPRAARSGRPPGMRREPNLPRAAGRELLQTHLPVNSAAARRVGSSLRAKPSPAIPSNESKRYLERSPENASQIKVTRAAEDEARHLVAAPAYLYLPGWGRACAKGLCCPVPYPSYLNASCGDPSLRQPFVCPRVGTYSIFLDLKCSDGSSSAA
jgi:hypothetical protein